ncbi:hypothetical protein LIER_12728 [Lithospermum erythrorhizon]|uniref:Uncharacterized protein n=1 Tax=Lithospermum erythrorhizon TaxID=34254 RepID=A0AAV3PUX7_LITER
MDRSKTSHERPRASPREVDGMTYATYSYPRQSADELQPHQPCHPAPSRSCPARSDTTGAKSSYAQCRKERKVYTLGKLVEKPIT